MLLWISMRPVPGGYLSATFFSRRASAAATPALAVRSPKDSLHGRHSRDGEPRDAPGSGTGPVPPVRGRDRRRQGGGRDVRRRGRRPPRSPAATRHGRRDARDVLLGQARRWRRRPVKIAQVAPLYEAVPPRLYGGTERVVAHLTDALVDLGHEVTLFASGDAQTSAKLVPVRDQAHPARSRTAEVRPRRPPVDAARGAPARATSSTSSTSTSTCCTSRSSRTWPARTVTTLHGRLDLKDLAGVYRRWPQFPLVSISRRPAPAAALRQLGRHGPPRPAARPLPLHAAAERRLPRLPRPHLAGEAARPRHRDRQARRACR